MNTKKVMRECEENRKAMAEGRSNDVIYDLHILDGDFHIGAFRWSDVFSAYVLYDHNWELVIPKGKFQVTPYTIKDIDDTEDFKRVTSAAIISQGIPLNRDAAVIERNAACVVAEKKAYREACELLAEKAIESLKHTRPGIPDLYMIDDMIEAMSKVLSKETD